MLLALVAHAAPVVPAAPAALVAPATPEALGACGACGACVAPAAPVRLATKGPDFSLQKKLTPVLSYPIFVNENGRTLDYGPH